MIPLCGLDDDNGIAGGGARRGFNNLSIRILSKTKMFHECKQIMDTKKCCAVALRWVGMVDDFDSWWFHLALAGLKLLSLFPGEEMLHESDICFRGSVDDIIACCGRSVSRE